MNAKKNSQGGFSLIELLVVVAIIGVLAAAGSVAYNKYLDGVKKDTHINNARAIAMALKTTGIARTSGLTVTDANCIGKNSGTLLGDAWDVEQAGNPIKCARNISRDGGFSSPFDPSGLKGEAYINSTVATDAMCGTTDPGGSVYIYKNALIVSSNGTEGFVTACMADGNPATDPISFGKDW